MLCGGLGLIIAAALFFAWRNSEAKWKRIIGWIAGVWAGISVIVYVVIGGLYLVEQTWGPISKQQAHTSIQTPRQVSTAMESTPQATNTSASTPRATDTPRPTMTPVPTAIPSPLPGDILFEDSFSRTDPEARWDLAKGKGFSSVITDGKLIASVANPDSFAAGVCNESFSDMDLRVEATILQGQEAALYGVSFGLRLSSDSYMLCVVHADNSAVCGEVEGEEIDWGELVRVQASPEVDSNLIRLVTSGNQWALRVNGQCIGGGKSRTAERGRVGLLAATDSDSGSSKIAYDDLVVRVPDKDSRALLACEPEPYEKTNPPTPQVTRTQKRDRNGTIYLSSETTAEATCRMSVWGGDIEDFLLDAGPGHPTSRVVPAGQYSWQMHFGPKGKTGVATMQLPPGGSCSFTCFDDYVSWGCSR